MGNWHRWLIRAEAGVYNGTIDPGTFGEVVARSGGQVVRRGLGILGRWPDTPDSVSAPPLGSSLALLGPDFRAPRTFRSSVGVAVALNATTRFELSGAYRHTDFLPRRSDLNLALAPSGEDQFGRGVFGNLVQTGSALGVEPGSNRRFREFDEVSALNPDGVSDYWALTARLERRVGTAAHFFASYTYSRTEDNWLFGRSGAHWFDISPFPRGQMTEWANSRSDFDIPHRLAVGAQLEVAMLRLAGFYRFESGFPFTPGFRNGVDANGDGSFQNDPAFVDDQIPGVADLTSAWNCLRGQVGKFAERNSCRGDPSHVLDLRLSVQSVRLGDHVVSVVAEGLNLLDPELAEVDRALYLVDPSGTLTLDPVTGDVAVPLIVNPAFGRPVTRWSTGRSFRFGLRLGH